jgi:transcriptional regulator with XRE-family HTH domain
MPSSEGPLAKAVQQKREAEGLSIRSLAAIVGISFSTLARIERGEGLPDNNSKVRLLEWLGDQAEDAGLTFDNVAFVHFRAAKNVRSSTVQALLHAAKCIRLDATEELDVSLDERQSKPTGDDEAVALSKEELEQTAERFRKELGLKPNQPLDSLSLSVQGVKIYRLCETRCIDVPVVKRLAKQACDEWSAMSVPVSTSEDKWAVLLNDCHTKERQRVTLLEEIWHILCGHKLTKIAKVAGSYGRTYDKVEEHDAYYLASACLLPKGAVLAAVRSKQNSHAIAVKFGTSSELVDYRIKRLGLWREHMGKKIEIAST